MGSILKYKLSEKKQMIVIGGGCVNKKKTIDNLLLFFKVENTNDCPNEVILSKSKQS